ncbi:MAG: SdiA-regulated domain-containing protein [Candidatus Poribacteria bacterium]|nr:SdiA-regulated domain-containing protein [Candidatus Poribacteria bacterium]
MRNNKIFVLCCFMCVSALLVYFLVRIEDADRKEKAALIPIELPYTWVGNISKTPITEPSGVTYHPGRRTLFVVDDEGHIHEIRPDGTVIQTKALQARDLEGITTHSITGWLYAAVEDDETILEIDPQTLSIHREFKINRTFEGKPLLKKGGMGIEAITFVPDATHPEGGTFWIGNQSFSRKPGGEPSVICEVNVPLLTSNATEAEGTIIRYIEMNLLDISGLAYNAKADSLVLISDTTNLLVELKRDGTHLQRYLLPGDDQEGVTLDGLGYMYIAQESGQIIKLADRRLR